MYTLLELFNLSMNYVGLGFRIWYYVLPVRRQMVAAVRLGDPHYRYDVKSIEDIAFVYSLTIGVRALSIISVSA